MINIYKLHSDVNRLSKILEQMSLHQETLRYIKDYNLTFVPYKYEMEFDSEYDDQGGSYLYVSSLSITGVNGDDLGDLAEENEELLQEREDFISYSDWNYEARQNISCTDETADFYVSDIDSSSSVKQLLQKVRDEADNLLNSNVW